MATKQDCINIFQETYPEASASSSRLFDEAYRSLLRRLNMRRTSGTVSAVQDQALYDLPIAETVDVESVYWVTSAAEATPLSYRSAFQSDMSEPGWREPLESALAPSFYSIESVPATVSASGTGKLQIRVYPAPDASAAGSPAYPHIKVFGRQHVAIATSTHSIGTDWIDGRPIISLMKVLHAEEQNDPAIAGLQEIHEQHVRRQVDFLSALSQEAESEVSFETIRNRRRRY